MVRRQRADSSTVRMRMGTNVVTASSLVKIEKTDRRAAAVNCPPMRVSCDFGPVVAQEQAGGPVGEQYFANRI
jgi:hypothetical protein